jgi:TRAP-type C4-dicarboxylate transport system permease small subunit
VTGLTTTVEALVGAACIAMGWACWQRATPVFRAAAVMLGIAGVVAIANAATALW